jgi:hypothetical protein
MNTHDFDDDDTLLRELAATLDRFEPVPEVALEAAYAASAMTGLDALLAELVFDSQDEHQLVGVRTGADTSARMLTFVNDHLTLDVELHGDGRTIVGQIDPPTEAAVTVERSDGSVTPVDVDQFGRFRVVVASGRMRLHVDGLLVTPWVDRAAE